MDKPDQTAASVRDVAVVGASAGGVEALRQLVRPLPRELPFAILIVLHTSPTGSALPGILARAGLLPCVHAEEGDEIVSGRVTIAPPDFHMTVDRDGIHLDQGPREHGHRPAIDPLLRSAARSFGTRVVGVILTGTQDDGSAGLRSVHEHGGLTVVQDPEEAPYPAMPLAALAAVEPDHVLRIDAIGALLVALAVKPTDELVA